MLPRDTRYRSTLSGGPYGVNPRRMPSMDFDIALQEAEFGVRPHDYPPYSPSPHPLNHMPMPYPPHHRYDEMVVYGNGNHSFSNNMESTQDLVRRTNLAVSLANHNVNPRSHVAQVHPMMCLDGGYPADFQTPMMIEDIKLLDSTQLNRILQEYRIPYDTHSLLNILAASGTRTQRVSVSSSRLRQVKFQLLFEHLGATRIVEEGGFKTSSRHR